MRSCWNEDVSWENSLNNIQAKNRPSFSELHTQITRVRFGVNANAMNTNLLSSSAEREASQKLKEELATVSELSIEYNHLEMLDGPIGRGNFGSVYSAKYKSRCWEQRGI